ncbi:type I-E CRISPR-associated protein Cse1/CasA [Actinokineospora sp.]|uniref:type I-E CRISPR-associated protein Cse1/CasA n=1 Tax=Actinokineospora sp. TaxID=1872133 RepID=UPI004038404D
MTESEALSFDLLDQPWLLVRQLDGRTLDMSLVDTLRRADRLAGLAGDVPTQVFALTRLLLAVLHSALRGPRDAAHWKRLWQRECLPMDEIEVYLDRHRHRFDLFHQETPFLQVAGLRTAKGEVSDLSKLIADVPNGRPFFSTRIGADLSLSFAEAARWLVHCHAFDPSGIKSGAFDDERVKGGKGYPIGTGWSGYLGGVLVEGRTLRETLLLNLIAWDFRKTEQAPDLDLPVWERAALGPAEEVLGGREPTGPVDLFTWPSRRIRLTRKGSEVVGVLVCNGDRSTPQNRHTVENHSAWRRSQAQEKKLRSANPVYMPLEHDPERAIWRGLQALLPGTGTSQGADAAARLAPGVIRWIAKLTGDRILDKDYPVRMHTIGMTYGSQSSTTAEIVDDALSIQAVLLTLGATTLKDVVLSCVQAAEDAAKALGSLAANLAEAAGGDYTGPRTRAIESGYAELDPLFRHWIRKLGPDSDATDCQIAWHRLANQAVRTLAGELLGTVSTTAWVGRPVKGRLVTSTHADIWFRRDLRKAVPLAYEDEAKTA